MPVQRRLPANTQPVLVTEQHDREVRVGSVVRLQEWHRSSRSAAEPGAGTTDAADAVEVTDGQSSDGRG